MTIDEFFALHDKSKFEYQEPGSRIREKETGSCPICYLVYIKTGKLYSDDDVYKAASEIGLSFNEAVKIVEAADGCPSPLEKLLI